MKIEEIQWRIIEAELQDDRIQELVTRQAEHLRELRTSVIQESLAANLVAQGRASEKAREERRERTSRLWQLGNLVRKAGILDLDEDVLRGALRSAAAFEGDARWTTRWRADGRRILGQKGRNGNAGTDPEFLAAGISADPIAARKALNHKILTAGGIVEQAGLGHRELAVLAGVLAAIARHRTDQSRVAAWKSAGATDTGKPQIERAHVEVLFPEPIARELGLQLQKFGMRFDREALVWLGFADPILVRRTAKTGDGDVRVRRKSRQKARKAGPRKKPAKGKRRSSARRSPKELGGRSEVDN